MRWAVFSILCMPLVSVIAYAAMRALALPTPGAVSIAFAQAPGIFAIYFFGAVFEEIGWTGYATERLQQRESILRSGLTIGAFWAAWHIVPWWIGQQHTFYWVIGQSIATILMRVIMGWIYANGGKSLFLAIVFHAMINTSYSLFPNAGSHYDPLILAAVLAIVIGVLNRSLWHRSVPPRARL
jgi:membrane protease YdiL (CAAX protease family)